MKWVIYVRAHDSNLVVPQKYIFDSSTIRMDARGYLEVFHTVSGICRALFSPSSWCHCVAEMDDEDNK